ncbi:carbohydrate esterase family 4 protein [Mycena pura]|uniref:Carbohydrate esterase family 4 protein n=1 Tax=Mycena pura TaxID=153505 RepID=A0AAD6V7T5_9AGAR|nr:carbohydrate esterase family 4 protein [Mycena pura]
MEHTRLLQLDFWMPRGRLRTPRRKVSSPIPRLAFAASVMLTAAVFLVALVGVGSALSLSPRDSMKVYTQCNERGKVALTFDDGPYQYMPDICKILEDNNITGTFFVNSNNWDCIYNEPQPTNLKAAYAAGHQIGLHTWSHPDLTTLTQSPDDMDFQFQANIASVQRIIGVYPAFMRPPYGNYNDDVLAYFAKYSLNPVTWNFDSEDSTDNATAEKCERNYDTIQSTTPGSAIALNHETFEPTAHEVLPYAIQQLRAKGYTFCTVAECVGLPPYNDALAVAPDPAPTFEWTCDQSS